MTNLTTDHRGTTGWQAAVPTPWARCLQLVGALLLAAATLLLWDGFLAFPARSARAEGAHDGLSAAAVSALPVDGADIGAGPLVIAHAEGPTRDREPIAPTRRGADVVAVAVQHPHISLTKTADPQTYSAADDVITYTFTVTNTGNVTLTNVMLRDHDFTGEGILRYPVFVGATMGSHEGILKPGEVATYVAVYFVAEADLDAGQVDNSATAIGTPPDGNDVSATDHQTVEAVDDEDDPQLNAALSLDKTAHPQNYRAAGDEITYTFTLTNTGNVTLTDVTLVEDSFTGSGACPDPVFVIASMGSPQGTLKPGEVAIYTAIYTITQADVDAGSVLNTATARGKDPDGNTDDHDDETVWALPAYEYHIFLPIIRQFSRPPRCRPSTSTSLATNAPMLCFLPRAESRPANAPSLPAQLGPAGARGR